jgi:hypothetical protein
MKHNRTQAMAHGLVIDDSIYPNLAYDKSHPDSRYGIEVMSADESRLCDAILALAATLKAGMDHKEATRFAEATAESVRTGEVVQAVLDRWAIEESEKVRQRSSAAEVYSRNHILNQRTAFSPLFRRA